jgi:signal peptidase I
MLFGIFRISGHSMMPRLNPGDRVIASSLPYFFSKPRIGDVIVFRYNGKTMVKRIKKFSDKKIIVAGDNSRDSLEIKPMTLNQILGKILFILNT